MTTRFALWGIRLILWSLLISIVLMGIFAKRGWIDWRRIVKQNQEIHAKVGEAAIHHQQLLHRISAFEVDRERQEVLIRQTLGYVRPDETVIEFD